MDLPDYFYAEGAVPDGYQLEIKKAINSPEAEKLEYDVFYACGYCEPSEQNRIMGYEPWRDKSLFHSLVDDHGNLIACVRVLVGRFEELPVGAFMVKTPQKDVDLGFTYDVLEYASLSLDEKKRGGNIIEVLFDSVYRHALVNSCGAMVAIGEQWLLDFLRGVHGIPFKPYSEPQWYMGGDCFAMGCDFDNQLKIQAVRYPEWTKQLLAPLDCNAIEDETIRNIALTALKVANENLRETL